MTEGATMLRIHSHYQQTVKGRAQVITISDDRSDYQMTAPADADMLEAIKAQAREYRQKADRAARLAAHLDRAAATLENQQ